MGYFKNLEIELQEIHDDELREIVAWDKAHQHKLTAEERWSILTNEVKLKRALVLYANELNPPAPKPASEHVALQSRRSIREPRRSRMCVMGWSLIAFSLIAGVTILVVSL
jgi:hypothetical protein